MKLFMFYIGGNCANSNIESHDVRFSIGETAAKEKEERPFQFQCAYIRIGIQERSLKKRGRAFSARSVATPLTALASSGKTEQMQPDHSGPIA
ncbi:MULTISPECIES: hypothetical protein [unclassified Rhizobium]|uniref:hypothetical protein n=1 Tax=unclassified Rhizobium TaxID=2613769 RepID=UPI00071591A8|nr:MULTISPECIES: hypothetical protein [unclassified Rhizobium]KQS85010.1 hypothetical protein ASG50_29315 [Rhizobium sp. Leaf386]KQS95750.1 hypothetical protein ASG42_28915 [Rhizobium sp. Leaf391]KQU05990.1 hypothetical protein ASG68_24900 [Rhizobium sp. Leaf453]